MPSDRTYQGSPYQGSRDSAGDRRRRQPCSGQVVTATGDGNRELSPSSCESSSTNIIRTVDVLIPRGTAPATTMQWTSCYSDGGRKYRVVPVQLMCSFIAGQRRRRRPPRRQRPARWDWSDVLCFSCGKSGHAATRCPNLNDSFPFMQPGWQTEKTPGGFIMIPPRVAMDHRRAENGS